MEYPDQSKKKEENPASLQKRKEGGGHYWATHLSIFLSSSIGGRMRDPCCSSLPFPRRERRKTQKSLLLFVRLFGSAVGGAHFV